MGRIRSVGCPFSSPRLADQRQRIQSGPDAPPRAGGHTLPRCAHRPGNPVRDLSPPTIRSRLPLLGGSKPLQLPLNSVVSIGADGTVSAKGSDGKMGAMISAARQFKAQMKMLQTAEANEKAAAQLLTAN